MKRLFILFIKETKLKVNDFRTEKEGVREISIRFNRWLFGKPEDSENPRFHFPMSGGCRVNKFMVRKWLVV